MAFCIRTRGRNTSFSSTTSGVEMHGSSGKTKPCFVLLERLDQAILDRYLRKLEESSEASVSLESSGKKHKKRSRGRPGSVKSYSKTQKGHKKIEEGSKDAQESELKDELVRRKRKIRAKPLDYTDDEDEFISANPKENLSEKKGDDELSPPLNESQNSQKNSGSEIRTPIENSEKNPEWGGSNKSNGKERNGLILGNALTDSIHKTEEKLLKPDTQPSGVLLKKNARDFSEKMDCVVSSNNNSINDYNLRKMEGEVEIVEEYGQYGSFETKVNWDKDGKRLTEAKGALIQKQEFEDEENDSRDEGEDDRGTVVFEKSLHDRATDFEEVLEMAEEKVRSVKKKFKKKKITNRKKRKLIKFKRKRSMMWRNLAKVKKLKTRYSAVGQQPTEKANQSVSECYVREVCGLVKRLHELYRIILQLQKDLPMDGDRADYFIRIIKAQQESFYEEIKKSQKSIMRGYDRMLSSFGNASTVSIEIGKRTSLSKEDIANVISRCARLGGCEEKKGEKAAGTEGEGLNSLRELSPQTFGVGDFSRKLKELINDKIEKLLSAETVKEVVGLPQSVRVEKSTKEGLSKTLNQPKTNPAPGSRNGFDPVTIPHPQSLHSSGNRRPPKSLQRPNSEPRMAKEVGAGENHPRIDFRHLPSGPPFIASEPHLNNFQGQWSDHSKQGPQFWPQKNYPHRTHVLFRDPVFNPFPQHDPRDVHGIHVQPLSSRPVHNQSSSVRAQYGGNGFPIHPSGTTAVSYTPNSVGFFQVPGGFVPPAPPMGGNCPKLHVPSPMEIVPYTMGYSQGRLPAHPFPQVPDSCSLVPGVRPGPLPPQYDRSRHVNAPSQINRSQKNYNCSTKPNNLRRRNIIPSSRSSESGMSGAPRQTAPKEGQCPLRTVITNLAGFSQPSAPTQTFLVTSPPGNLQRTQVYKAQDVGDTGSTGPASESVKCEGYALDPTVPQKLTMRNHRLEAGPILKPKSESSESEGGGSSNRWQEASSDARGCEVLNQKELNSRVYVCAQNGCKNPGVRICKGCLSIIYCSETCQLKHWTLKHKTECHQLKELRG